ncbi:Tim44/TimA family putative adaptor protein [Aestuariibius sp. HNIBRBA575]|uniref:Tim44/TimA family putative adaptor protein n=1 Tax=Aestuariibius sp. HNIBRBA575 TaxID=3233343 RepID=UPI0034A4DC9A
MNSPIIQLIVLAGVAIFLILRLRSVLGTRDGFEQPRERAEQQPNPRREFEVIEGGPDRDITDHVEENSDDAKALAAMKKAEPSFGVSDFMQGARGAYEMILMAFERGDLGSVKAFLSDDVYAAFAGVVEQREKDGVTIEATFIGVADMAIQEVEFDEVTSEGEISMRFVGELTSIVRDNAGDVIEGSDTEIKRQRDIWTFARKMGANDPNWQLVATSE